MTRRQPALIVALLVVFASVAVVFIATRSGRKTGGGRGKKVTPSTGRRVTERPVAASLPPEAGVAIDDEPTGALLLEGLVVDAADKPVPGARVAIDSHPRREVRSGEDGSFAVDG